MKKTSNYRWFILKIIFIVNVRFHNRSRETFKIHASGLDSLHFVSLYTYIHTHTTPDYSFDSDHMIIG